MPGPPLPVTEIVSTGLLWTIPPKARFAEVRMPLKVAFPPVKKGVVIPLALKFPDASLFTIALGVFALVGATFQSKPNVPLPVTGEPLTLKSDAGAVRAMLLTVPVPGNACPDANVNRPVESIFNPVSLGAVVPSP
jgi:hypothetical protein